MYDNIAKPFRGFFVYHRYGDKRFLSTGTKYYLEVDYTLS